MSCHVAATAQSWLFVPGDRPDRFAKATRSGAHVTVFDIENAVPEGEKPAARRRVADFLGSVEPEGCAVRINSLDTPWHSEDLSSLAGWPGTVVLPKAEDPRQVGSVIEARSPGAGFVALVETASGVLNAALIAAAEGVNRLAFGSFDLAVQIGVDPTDRTALATARQLFVLASAAAGLSGPIDGVTGDLRHPDRLIDDLHHAVRLGFAGKLCIHPNQLAAVESAFLPAPDDVEWAQRVLDAWQSSTDGVAVVDGHMIDRPVVDRARAIRARLTSSARPLASIAPIQGEQS